MKARFITRHTMVDPKSGTEWWGTCKFWMLEGIYFGLKLKKTERVLWVGEAPTCHFCSNGMHSKTTLRRAA